jgi:hypothetical protein
MTSAEHLARDLSMQSRGIHVLSWDNKADLVRALLIIRAAPESSLDSPTVVPTVQTDLQLLGLRLFEEPDDLASSSMRVFIIPQASTEAIGTWLNGWRRRLADPPGTLIVIRQSDLMALYRRAPDLMSFAQSEIHESAGLLPLVTRETFDRVCNSLPAGWQEALNSLPGSTPSVAELSDWLSTLRSNIG